MTTQLKARRFRLASSVTAAVLAVLVVLLAVASVPLYAVNSPECAGERRGEHRAGRDLRVVGLVIARRQPRNPIGWLMLAGPYLELISADGTVYAELTYRPGYHLPFGVVGILLTEVVREGGHLIADTPGSMSNTPARPCTTTALLWQNSLWWISTPPATCLSTGLLP